MTACFSEGRVENIPLSRGEFLLALADAKSRAILSKRQVCVLERRIVPDPMSNLGWELVGVFGAGSGSCVQRVALRFLGRFSLSFLETVRTFIFAAYLGSLSQSQVSQGYRRM